MGKTEALIFPPSPPAPTDVANDPSLLASLDERVKFDNEKKLYVMTDVKGTTQVKFQYSFVVKRWIPVGDNTLDLEDFEDKDNRERIKQSKKQKLDTIKLSKEISTKSERGIFLSNLPEVSEHELVETFEKYGQIATDKVSGSKVKLYFEPNGKFKEEALIIFENEKSVDLSIQMMNGVILKNKPVKVERAVFDKRGSIDDIKSKFYAKIVVLENMFIKSELETDKFLSKDIEDDVRDECANLGITDILNVSLFPNSGVLTVKFKTNESATKKLLRPLMVGSMTD